MKTLGYLWAATTVLLVLPLGLLLWLCRQIKPTRWSVGAWEWERVSGSALDDALFFNSAITLGWVILWRKRQTMDRGFPFCDIPQLASHERRHVWQSFWMGPFYLPVYLLLCVVGYDNNPMEVDARKHEVNVWPPEANSSTNGVC